MSMRLGGAETHILELCKELSRRGEDVTVASAGGELVRSLKEEGIEHVTLPLDKKDIFSVILSRRAAERLISRGGFDIVHAHARIPAFIFSGICKKHDVRFVTTAHGAFSVTPLWRHLSRWGEHTFAVSEDIARYLRRNYKMESSNISLIPNGIDRERFKLDMALREEERAALCANGRTVVLHVSRLDGPSSKCAEAFIRAAGEMSDERYLFVVVGGGDRLWELSELAEKINILHKRRIVIMCGAKTDVLPYLCAADVFVGPSRAALEAMSVGVPTIISGSEGHIGMLCEENFDFARSTNLCARGAHIADKAELCDGISHLTELNAEERGAIISLQERMLSYYSIRSMVDICEREYRRLSMIRTATTPLAVICGYYGFGNAGDRAMLQSLISGIRGRIGDASLCVMSSAPKKTSGEFVVSSVYRYNVVAIKRALRRSGTLIFGGGNLLQDKTSSRSLMYYLWVIKAAKKAGARVIIYANGIGPVSDKSMGRVMAALRLADRVSIRERGSLELCLKNGIDAVLTSDAAFSLGIAPQRDDRGGYFVITPKRGSDDELSSLCDVICKIRDRHGLTPVVAAMYPKQDGAFCKKISERTGALMLEDGITDYGIVSDFVRGAEFVISSRFHTLVCSAAVGCPMIGVGGGKIFGIMSDLGVSRFAVGSFDDVPTAADEIMRSRGEISDIIMSNAKKAHEMALCEIDAVVKEISREKNV